MSFPTRSDFSFWAHKKAPGWGQSMAGTKPSIDYVVNSHADGKTRGYEREWNNFGNVLRLRLKQNSVIDSITESFFRGSNHLDMAVRLLRRLDPNHPYLSDQIVVYRGKPRELVEEQGKFSPKAKARYKAVGREMQAEALLKRTLKKDSSA